LNSMVKSRETCCFPAVIAAGRSNHILLSGPLARPLHARKVDHAFSLGPKKKRSL
jgi:hypothetical protein